MSSKNIDERIVEMRFDNKQFESGVKETMGTLDRLKQALNLTSSRKSIENLDKAVQNVSFDQMSKSLSSIEKRFSAMGIVGMRVIQNLTDSAMGQFGRAAAFVKESVVGGGVRRAMNIENAHFQLQALLKDEKKVQAVMDDAMDAVDGTAYGFDEAAKAASQFAASGLKAGKEMQMALKGITGVSAMTNREFSEIATIFTTVAGNGRLMGDQLLQFSDRGLNAASTLKDYFVEVKGLTGTTEQDIRDMVSKGEISFKTFAKAMGWAFGDSAKRANETFNGSLSNMKAALARIGAGFVSPLVEQNSQLILLFNAMKDRINDVKKVLVFDEAIGNTEALSKQFTDSVLAMAKVATDFLNNADLTKPLQMFYYGFESVKNVAKGTLSVLKPVGSAFHDVFGLPTIDEIATVIEKVEELTSKLKLTSKQNDNLKTTFVGIFDIVKLVRDGAIKLVEAFIPVEKPIGSTADQLLSLTATMGKGLSAFSKWVRQSPTIAKGYNVVSKAIERSMNSLSESIRGIDEFLDEASDLPEVQNFLSGIARIFNILGTVSAPYVGYLSRKIEDFRATAMIMIPEATNKAIERFLKLIDDIGTVLNNLDLSKPIDWIRSLGETMEDVFSSIGKNRGSINIKGLPFDAITEKIGKIKDTIGSFVSWFKENFGKVFEDMSFGNVVSGGVGIGMVYSMVKMAKTLANVTGALKGIPDIFKSIGDVLDSYQKSLDAKALKDIAIAIGIITASLVVLSFADADKVTGAAIQLSIITGLVMVTVDKLTKLIDKIKGIKNPKLPAKNMYEAISNIGYYLGKGFKQFGKAAKWRQIAGAIRSFGETLLMIVGAIAIVQILNKEDPEGFKTALNVIEGISAIMLGIMAVMTLVGSKFGNGMKAFSSAAKGMQSLSIAMLVVTIALGRLMKMDLPTDYKTKLGIFAGLFGGVAILGTVLTKISNGGKKTKMSAGTVLALAALLYATVGALNRLFKMDLPTDYKTKLGILAGIFAGMVIIVGALGKAAKSSGGTVKATGTLLAFAVDIAAIVGALLILSLIPGEKLLKGAIALGAVILALGKALKGIGKGDSSNYKSVLAMALMIGAIVAAFGILSMISPENLLKAGTALGAMLLVLAVDLHEIGKSAGGIDWKSIAALAAETVIIAASLYFLSDKPWANLLVAAIAMSAVLFSIAGTMKIITSAGTPNANQLTGFLLGVVAIIPIALALNELAKNDWKSLLASGIAIGMVLLAIGEMLNKVSSTPPPSVEALGGLLIGALSVIPISIALNELAKNDWKSLLSAGTAIAEVLTSLGIVLGICAKVGPSGMKAVKGIGILDLLIADLVAVLAAMGAIYDIEGVGKLIDSGAEFIKKIGNAIGGFVGGIVDGFIDSSTESLPEVGTRLSDFMTNLEPFFNGINNIKEESLEKTTTFIQSLTSMCQSIQSLYSWLQTVDLATFNTQMQDLGSAIVDFSDSVGGIDPESIEGAKGAAEIMAALVKAIPTEGGLKGLIFGDQDLGSFGDQLKNLGKGLKSFVTETEGITEDSVKGASAAVSVLSDLAHSIPSSGSTVVKWLIGEKNLGSFGGQIFSLGYGLSLFCAVTDGITEDSVKGAANAVSLLIDLSNSLSNTKSVVGFFTGSNKQNLSDFGDNLTSLGSSLVSFTEQLKSVDLSGIDGAVSAIGKLVDVSNKVAEGNQGSLGAFVYNMQDIGSNGISNLTSAFEHGTSDLVDSANTLMESVIKTLKDKLEGFATIGNDMGQKLISAFLLKKPSASSTASDFAHAITSKVRNGLDSLYDIGEKGSEGLVRGFRSHISDARTAGRDIAEAMSDSTKKKLDEHSPSRVMRKIGDFAGLGFVNGFLYYISKAKEAGKSIGESSMNGLNDAITKSKTSYNELFKNPVIQPVVDSSKVYAAASEIDKMFNRTVNLQAGRLSGFNSTADRSGMRELLSAIKGLKSSENESKYGNTYTIGNITYTEGSDVGVAFKSLVRAIQLEGRA